MDIPMNALDMRNAKAIAFKLLHFVLGKRWNQLSVVQKKQYIEEIAKLLWDKYIQKCSTKSSHEEAAIEAIDEVIEASLESSKSLDA